MTPINIAVSTYCQGKGPQSFATEKDKDQWFNGLNTSFRNVKYTIKQLLDSVLMGYPYTAPNSGRRTAEQITMVQHVSLDFDGGRTLDEALSDHFILKHAAFMYTSSSHTDEVHKYRVFFAFDTPLTIHRDIQDIGRAIIHMYGNPDDKDDPRNADPSCKDGHRLWFGSVGAKAWVFSNGKAYPYDGGEMPAEPNIMTLAEYGKLVVHPYREYKELQERKRKQRMEEARHNGMAKIDSKRVRAFIGSLTNRIATAPPTEKHTTRLTISRAVGGYVATGLLPYRDALDLLMVAAMSNTDQREQQIEKVIRDGLDHGLKSPLYLEDNNPLQMTDEQWAYHVAETERAFLKGQLTGLPDTLAQQLGYQLALLELAQVKYNPRTIDQETGEIIGDEAVFPYMEDDNVANAAYITADRAIRWKHDHSIGQFNPLATMPNDGRQLVVFDPLLSIDMATEVAPIDRNGRSMNTIAIPPFRVTGDTLAGLMNPVLLQFPGDPEVDTQMIQGVGGKTVFAPAPMDMMPPEYVQMIIHEQVN